MATNPDPALELTTLSGKTRTLYDWNTIFHLCLVFLPARADVSSWITIGQKIFRTFGDADCHCAFVIAGDAETARRVLGRVANQHLVFCDPESAFIKSLGLTRLPAFVHIRQNATLEAAAEGWDPQAWQQVADGLGRAMAWSVPDIPDSPAPAAFAA